MGDSQNAFDHFRALVRCTELNEIGDCALKMVQLIQMGKVENGAMSMTSKVNSRHGRWFGQKKKSVLIGDNMEGGVDLAICIYMDGVVQVKYICGKSESAEYYWVLCLSNIS